MQVFSILLHGAQSPAPALRASKAGGGSILTMLAFFPPLSGVPEQPHPPGRHEARVGMHGSVNPAATSCCGAVSSLAACSLGQ
jgi:hypothetical protein